MTLVPVTTTSDSSTVTATAAGLGGSMATGQLWMFVSSTNCWIKQGTTQLVTCATNANMTDGDYITIAVENGSTKTYEYDKSANGVVSGRVSWAAGAATAADVAATLATAIAGAQPELTVTDNTDGTLTITLLGKVVTITENVAHASFTVAAAAVPATAADGSMFVPALVTVVLDGNLGPQVGVIRDTADGKASLTRLKTV